MAETITLTKDQLLAQLEKARPTCKLRDRIAMRDHKRDVGEAYRMFQRRLVEARKWTRDEALANGYSVEVPWQEKNQLRLECPLSLEDALDHHIAVVTLSNRKTYTLTNNGYTTTGLWNMVTIDLPKPKKVC